MRGWENQDEERMTTVFNAIDKTVLKQDMFETVSYGYLCRFGDM